MQWLVQRLKAQNPNGSVSIHEILGGNLRDGRNDILKSPQLIDIEGKTAQFISEPYDNAFKTNNIDNSWESFERLERKMNRRKKAIFKAMDNKVDRIDVTVYDSWETLGGFSVSK